MWKNIFSGFYLLHAGILILAAIGFFRFWKRTRFWLPTYIHVLAGIAFAVMLWIFSMAPADAPVNKWGPVSRFLFSLSLPAIVYFFFIFYGGQHIAYTRKVGQQVPCPFCGILLSTRAPEGNDVASFARFLEPTCPNCGRTLEN
jgi:hypothetical protein